MSYLLFCLSSVVGFFCLLLGSLLIPPQVTLAVQFTVGRGAHLLPDSQTQHLSVGLSGKLQ